MILKLLYYIWYTFSFIIFISFVYLLAYLYVQVSIFQGSDLMQMSHAYVELNLSNNLYSNVNDTNTYESNNVNNTEGTGLEQDKEVNDKGETTNENNPGEVTDSSNNNPSNVRHIEGTYSSNNPSNLSPIQEGFMEDGRYYNESDWRIGNNPNFGYRPSSEYDTSSDSIGHDYPSCSHYPGEPTDCEHGSIRHWACDIDPEDSSCHQCGEQGAESLCLNCKCLFHDSHTPRPAIRPEYSDAENNNRSEP